MINQESICPEQKFQLAQDIVVRKNNDGTIIVMIMDDSNLFYKVDGVAAEVFSLLEQEKSYGEVIDLLSNKHSVSTELLKKDSFTFLKDLERLEMLDLSSSGAIN